MTPFDFWLALWIEGFLLPSISAHGRALEKVLP